ncbi:MAG: VOC family protein [Eubacteriales bacterium]|nr:VOC family protein [Eubacteriales bacterium]
MRTAFMAYLTGSVEAVDFYCKAFNTTSRNCFKASDDDDFYAHAEVLINGEAILGISEKSLYETEFANGNNMQFWVTFDDEQAITAAYEKLKEQGEVQYPLGSCDWSKLLADVTDKYGIHWMLNFFKIKLPWR